jgi:hypothetical protein
MLGLWQPHPPVLPFAKTKAWSVKERQNALRFNPRDTNPLGRGASVRLRGLEQCLEHFPMNSAWGGPVVFECGRRSVLVAGLQALSTSLGMAWAIPFQRLDSALESNPTVGEALCSGLFQRRASGSFIPIEMTVPTWPRHACKVLCINGGCVGGSPVGAFKGLWSSRARHLGAVSGGDSMTGSIKSPRARNPAARTTDCLLDRACFAVLSRKLRYESSSSHLWKCSSKLLAPSFSLPVLPSSDDTVLQARTSSRRRR